MKIMENEIEDHDQMEICWVIRKTFFDSLNMGLEWIRICTEESCSGGLKPSIRDRIKRLGFSQHWELTIKSVDLAMNKGE